MTNALTLRTSVTRLIVNLEGVLTSADHQIAKFRSRLNEDPFYAFEWADDAMEASARKRAATYSLSYLKEEGLEDDQRAARLIAFWMSEVLSGARSPRRSTSAPSNVLASYVTSAYASFLETYVGDKR